jgi:hypothetical protein
MIYHEPVPGPGELRLPPGVALLEARPFEPPAGDIITRINVTAAERRGKEGGESCIVA